MTNIFFKKTSYLQNGLELFNFLLDVLLRDVPLPLLQVQSVRQRQLVRLESQRQRSEFALKLNAGILSKRSVVLTIYQTVDIGQRLKYCEAI